MATFKENWLQCMFEMAEMFERDAEQSSEYLRAEEKKDLAKEAILNQISEEDRVIVRKYLGVIEEASMEQYNMMLKEVLLGLRFRKFDE